MPDPVLEIREGAGHTDPEITGGGGCGCPPRPPWIRHWSLILGDIALSVFFFQIFCQFKQQAFPDTFRSSFYWRQNFNTGAHPEYRTWFKGRSAFLVWLGRSLRNWRSHSRTEMLSILRLSRWSRHLTELVLYHTPFNSTSTIRSPSEGSYSRAQSLRFRLRAVMSRRALGSRLQGS